MFICSRGASSRLDGGFCRVRPAAGSRRVNIVLWDFYSFVVFAFYFFLVGVRLGPFEVQAHLLICPPDSRLEAGGRAPSGIR